MLCIKLWSNVFKSSLDLYNCSDALIALLAALEHCM